MLALLDNGQDLDQCAAELGCETGQLLTPLTRYRLRHPDRPWGIDNGFFSPSPDENGYLCTKSDALKAFDAALHETWHRDPGTGARCNNT